MLCLRLFYCQIQLSSALEKRKKERLIKKGGKGCTSRSRPFPFRQPSSITGIVAGGRIHSISQDSRCIAVGEDEEPQVGDFEVAEEGGGRSAGAEGDEVVIVVMDDPGEWGEGDEGTC